MWLCAVAFACMPLVCSRPCVSLSSSPLAFGCPGDGRLGLGLLSGLPAPEVHTLVATDILNGVKTRGGVCIRPRTHTSPCHGDPARPPPAAQEQDTNVSCMLKGASKIIPSIPSGGRPSAGAAVNLRFRAEMLSIY